MIRMSRLLSKYGKNSAVIERSGKYNTTSSRFCSNDNRLELRKNQSFLYRYLYSKILSCGPITVAEYMKEVLTHPTAGYYMKKDVFGEKGDFITSPEISQLFGEMIAIWIVSEWKKITDHPFQIVELGPGRGTLMKDILRVMKQLQRSADISIHLIEISPALSLVQAKNLCTTYEDCKEAVTDNEKNVNYYRKGVTEADVNVYWYYSVNDVPRDFTVFIAHEFFDALPIHKFQKTDRGWREVLIDIIEEGAEEKFRYVLSNSPNPASETYITGDEERDQVEVSPQTMVVADYISQFLFECGGFALFLDYGHSGEKTDTFRAFRKHVQQDPLMNPGTSDLTADVDFSVIKTIAERDNRMLAFGPVTQSTFLRDLGINVRLLRLLKNATKDQKEQLASGYRMIMDDDKMGTCFKVLALFPFVLQEHLQKWKVPGFQTK